MLSRRYTHVASVHTHVHVHVDGLKFIMCIHNDNNIIMDGTWHTYKLEDECTILAIFYNCICALS